jgi:peptidoglycan/LPS O-acetylase OafA/YrhL
MNRSTSIYLDLVRFLAATTVLIGHANFDELTGGLPYLSGLNMATANDAVIVFFVLSGLVIAYVADTKENTLREFFLSRLARLWSVVVPALLLTVILDYAGSRIAPSLYDPEWTDNPVLRLAANLFFVNELWFSSIRPFSNAPFWSIGYEFWYYVVFAAAFFVRRPASFGWLGLVALVIGPRILVLLPIWLLGVWVYYRTITRPVNAPLGWLLVLCSAGGYLLYLVLRGHEYLFEFTVRQLGMFEYIVRKLGIGYANNFFGWSNHFLSNYLVGILVAAHFLGIAAIAPTVGKVLLPLAIPIRAAAAYTFSIYLFHFPLLRFFAAMTLTVQNASLRRAIILFGTIGSIWLLGNVTEKRRSALKRTLAQAYSGLERVLTRAPVP